MNFALARLRLASGSISRKRARFTRGEEQVAGFFFQAAFIVRLRRSVVVHVGGKKLGEFVQLFVDFFDDVFGAFPIEFYAGGFAG